MSPTVDAAPRADCATEHAHSPFTVSVAIRGVHSLVCVGGELDIATRSQVLDASMSNSQSTVIVDLSELSFMDCAGYSGLSESRLALEGTGRSMLVRGASGQPARLIAMIECADVGSVLGRR
jgi:anti-anti-sigma factor